MTQRMNWEQLICDTRLGQEHYKDKKAGTARKHLCAQSPYPQP